MYVCTCVKPLACCVLHTCVDDLSLARLRMLVGKLTYSAPHVAWQVSLPPSYAPSQWPMCMRTWFRRSPRPPPGSPLVPHTYMCVCCRHRMCRVAVRPLRIPAPVYVLGRKPSRHVKAHIHARVGAGVYPLPCMRTYAARLATTRDLLALRAAVPTPMPALRMAAYSRAHALRDAAV